MKKVIKVSSLSLAAGILVGSGFALSDTKDQYYSLASNTDEPEVGSIQLNPGMYIPEVGELRNQAVDREDVVKTLNIEAIKLAKQIGLAEISAGIEIHLERGETALTGEQLAQYKSTIQHYGTLIQQTAETAKDELEVEIVVQQFRTWVASFRNEINEYIKQSGNKVEAVAQVPNEPVVLTDKISYALPTLGDEYLTYMPYTAITAKTTPHYKLQQIASTTEDGYRTYAGHICIALASSFGTQIGTLYEITFEDGKVMKAILSDNKSDKHTDAKKQYRDATERYDGTSGNIVEILFDTSVLTTMPEINKKINSDYPAKVKSIVKTGVAEEFNK